MAKLSREEIEYGIKEFVQGLLIGVLIGFLLASQIL
jgi:F0F1-type ATP synthase assembly protein I